jgi:restriction system protein
MLVACLNAAARLDSGVSMPIPDFQTVMLPLLRFASDDGEHAVREATDALADQFQLTSDEREQLVPSGQQRTFSNRVSWAVSYLKQSGLLESPGRGRFRISQRGRDVLTSPPDRITIRYLAERFPEFREFRSGAKVKSGDPVINAADEEHTPEERLEAADTTLRTALERELLDRVKQVSPAFFEQLVLKLVTTMGYGGSAHDAAEHLGRSGDDGVDGVINEDKLGLDVVYLQAKRWGDQPVRRPDVQAFAGSLEGQRARKGVFITTSHFTADAREYVGRIEKRIVLIDGKELARLMIEHDVGVTQVKTYRVLRLDESFFEEAVDA